jgi:hypothetical protein
MKGAVPVASLLLASAVAACGGGAAPAEPQESRLSRLVARQRCASAADRTASAPPAASQPQGASALSKDARNCPGG